MVSFLKRLLFSTGLLISSGSFVSAASGDVRTRTIHGQRIVLADIATNISSAVGQVDLGKAPPPGRSRYLSYEEMASRLRAAGLSASNIPLPRGVRVRSKAKQFTAAELKVLVLPKIQGALPVGIVLHGVEVSRPHVLSPAIKVGKVHLPRFVLRDGEQSQTGTVELLWGSRVALRLPVKMRVTIDGSHVGQVVKRGSSIKLVIKKGNVVISALAQTLSSGRVGDTVSLRVGVTKKVMSARLVSTQMAEMEL